MHKTYIIFSTLFLSHLILGISGVSLANLLPATAAILAFNSMAFSIILAARWRLIDKLIGGADKAYSLHRIFGYITVMTSIAHWLSADEALAGIFPALSDAANEIGEFAVILLLLLALISALKLIPYHIWKKSHRLMGPLFMILVFHTFFSQSPIQVGSVIWWLEVLVSSLAIIAWISTFKLSSPSQQLIVTAVKQLPNAIDITVVKAANATFKPGQFANISLMSSTDRDAHPFTIASSENSEKMRFIIKNAGDATQYFKQNLKVGDNLCLHSIRGGFRIDCSDDRKPQIWVAGGVGITPFLAALEHLSLQTNDSSRKRANIDLFYAPSTDLGDNITAQLERYQQQLSFFKVHFLAKSERLSLDHFNLLADHWQCSSLYLCGPANLKESARAYYTKGGGKARIYSESFDFRAAIAQTDVLNYMQQQWPKTWQLKREDFSTLLLSAQRQWIKHANIITRR